MVNPCPCCSLTSATKFIAIAEMVSSVILFVIIASLGGIDINNWVSGADNFVHAWNILAGYGLVGMIAGIVIYLVLLIITFCLGWVLKQGAEQENIVKCRTWVTVTTILLLLMLLAFIIVSIFSGWPRAWLIPKVFGVACSSYCTWVVTAFIREIKTKSVSPVAI